MPTLLYPWLLLLLPLPLLVYWWAPPHREPRQGLIVPFLTRLAASTGREPTEETAVARGGWFRAASLLLCWILAVSTVARPQIIEPPVSKEIPVRDLLLAVDLSASMGTKDFKDKTGNMVTRLEAVKEVIDDFLTRRKGDRVGLILFGSAPFIQVPLTEDLQVCRELLNEAQVNMAGPQTAFGDAIGLAITLFERSKVKERVLIVLTDGNDTASKVPPVKAAEIAKENGIVIHTVAIGDPRAVGEEALDVQTLKEIATQTGGLSAYAEDRSQLEAIYNRLDRIETHHIETISHRPRRDIYWWPLAAGLAISVLQQIVQLGLSRHHVRRGLQRHKEQEEVAV